MFDIEKAIRENVRHELNDKILYVCEAKYNHEGDTGYYFNLPFVPFVGLLVNINNGKYFKGTITHIEWNSEKKEFDLQCDRM